MFFKTVACFPTWKTAFISFLKAGVIEKLPIPVSPDFLAELNWEKALKKTFKYVEINRLHVVGWLLNSQKRTPAVTASLRFCQPISD